MTQQNKLKKLVGWAAIDYVRSDTIIGIGTGSTVSYFIDALKTTKTRIRGVVSSSKQSSIKLKNLGIPLLNLNSVDELDIYVDGADEINNVMQMIKGGGGALTREKILSYVAKKFICIVDCSKLSSSLGIFPLPVEVIPMARSWVTRELFRLGGQPVYRNKFRTDNGNIIIDVHNLKILDAISLEDKINSIPGVVTVGLFARRSADIALIATEHGIITIN